MSLLSVPDSLNKEAKNTFMLIMKYMEDYPNKTPECLLVQELITIGLNNYQLRDEIFCQLCKQTTLNPRRSGTFFFECNYWIDQVP